MRTLHVVQWYAAAMCFVSAIAVTISGGAGVYDVVQMRAPAIGIDGQAWHAHQHNRDFLRWYVPRHRHVDVAPDRNMPQPEIEAAITQLRNESFAALLAAQRHNAARECVREVIIFFVALSLFWVHWRLLKTMRDA